MIVRKNDILFFLLKFKLNLSFYFDSKWFYEWWSKNRCFNWIAAVLGKNRLAVVDLLHRPPPQASCLGSACFYILLGKQAARWHSLCLIIDIINLLVSNNKILYHIKNIVLISSLYIPTTSTTSRASSCSIKPVKLFARATGEYTSRSK